MSLTDEIFLDNYSKLVSNYLDFKSFTICDLNIVNEKDFNTNIGDDPETWFVNVKFEEKWLLFTNARNGCFSHNLDVFCNVGYLGHHENNTTLRDLSHSLHYLLRSVFPNKNVLKVHEFSTVEEDKTGLCTVIAVLWAFANHKAVPFDFFESYVQVQNVLDVARKSLEEGSVGNQVIAGSDWFKTLFESPSYTLNIFPWPDFYECRKNRLNNLPVRDSTPDESSAVVDSGPSGQDHPGAPSSDENDDYHDMKQLNKLGRKCRKLGCKTYYNYYATSVFSRKKSAHYHCKICDSFCCRKPSRLLQHSANCGDKARLKGSTKGKVLSCLNDDSDDDFVTPLRDRLKSRLSKNEGTASFSNVSEVCESVTDSKRRSVSEDRSKRESDSVSEERNPSTSAINTGSAGGPSAETTHSRNDDGDRAEKSGEKTGSSSVKSDGNIKDFDGGEVDLGSKRKSVSEVRSELTESRKRSKRENNSVSEERNPSTSAINTGSAGGPSAETTHSRNDDGDRAEKSGEKTGSSSVKSDAKVDLSAPKPALSTRIVETPNTDLGGRLEQKIRDDFEEIIKNKCPSTTKQWRDNTRCHNLSCLNNLKHQTLLHYHCPSCSSFKAFHFNRIVQHFRKCDLTNIQTPETSVSRQAYSHNVDQSTINVVSTNETTDETRHSVTDHTEKIVACKSSECHIKSNKNRNVRIHYHCSICNKHQHQKSRMEKHYLKCSSNSIIKHRKPGHSKTGAKSVLLQSELICPREGIYLVRKSEQGPAAPVHVEGIDGKFQCESNSCKDLFEFQKNSLNPGFVCEHQRSCIEQDHETKCELFTLDMVNTMKSEDDRANVEKICAYASSRGTPVVKDFVPIMKDPTSSPRFVYFSVFSDVGVRKYYNRFGRVLVTLDRDKMSLRCACTKNNRNKCIHEKICLAVVEKYDKYSEPRPENNLDVSEVEHVNKMMNYILSTKSFRIPLDVKAQIESTVDTKREFVPTETKCSYCDCDLQVLKINDRGFLFTLRKKVAGIRIITKCCPNSECKAEYRYCEHREGYFNFNNSSVFTLELLEFILGSWEENVPLETTLKLLKHITFHDHNVHMVGEAAKSYLSLKDLDISKNMCCVRCGDYPVHLSLDVIRNVCTDVDPEDFTESLETTYSNFSSLYEAACKSDLARAYLNKKSPQYNANRRSFRVKISNNLPPCMSPTNFEATPDYTRAKVRHDKPEEITIPTERLEQILSSAPCRGQLVDICKRFKIDVTGGKVFMVNKILSNDKSSEVWSIIRKRFLKIFGKSGGLLRATCQHGIVYAVKFLTLPESVADYLSVLGSFKIPPTFVFSDIASLLASHVNNHIENFFRPDGGRLDSPEDPRSDLYKNGFKKKIFDIKAAHCSQIVDISNYDSHTAHPISGIVGRYSLYDRFHEKNHNEWDAHLRLVDNTNFEGWLNTQSSEQQNHKISLSKSFANQLSHDTFIKLVMYLTCKENKKTNALWQSRVEKMCKLETAVDNLGFLVKVGTNKHDLSNRSCDLPLHPKVCSSPNYPIPVFQNDFLDLPIKSLASSINSLSYLLGNSPVGCEIANVEVTKDKFNLAILQNYAMGTSIYDSKVHFRICENVYKACLTAPDRQVENVTWVFSQFFQPVLANSGLLYSVSNFCHCDLGISLSSAVNKQEMRVDYVILNRENRDNLPAHILGPKEYFDIEHGSGILRYRLLGFATNCYRRNGNFFQSRTTIMCDSCFYDIEGTKLSAIPLEIFLSSARSAQLFIFKFDKLTNDAKQNFQNTTESKCTPEFDTHDPFKFSEIAPPLRKKQKHVVVDRIRQPPAQPWLPQSNSGRLAMTTAQKGILESETKWFDDCVVNSFSRMLQVHSRSAFVQQDSLLACADVGSGQFKSVDGKFIQIFNIREHWICVSNVCTNAEEPHVVEIFDSMASGLHGRKQMENQDVLNSQLSRYIKQIKPHCNTVRYVKTQTQTNCNDCGPFALGFMWCLTRGFHPLSYKNYIQPRLVRKSILKSFISDYVQDFTLCTPDPYVKRECIKSFTYCIRSRKFKAQ